MNNKKNTKLQNDQQHNQNRRKLVLGSLGGAAAVGAWQTPVINAVFLPAHAQTSVVTPPPPPAPVAGNAFFGAAPAVPLDDSSIFDVFLSPAYAGAAAASSIPISDDFTVQAVRIGTTDNFTVNVFEELKFDDPLAEFTNIQVLFTGTVNEAAGGTLSVSTNPCMYTAADITAAIVSVSATSMNLSFTSRSTSFVLPVGEGMLPSPMCTQTPPPPLPQAFNLLNEPHPFFSQQAQVEKSTSPLDFLISSANAGVVSQLLPVLNFLAQANGMDSYTVTYQDTSNGDERSGNLDTNGDSGSLMESGNSCSAPAITRTASIVSVSQTELVLSVDFGDGFLQFTLLVGPATLPMIQCQPTPE